MKKKHQKLPKFGRLILRILLEDEDYYQMSGDIDEVMNYKSSEEGKFKALKWYTGHLLKSIPQILITSIYWSYVMLKNYFKVTFRTIRKQKIYSFINILGLAVGMTCCILILLWVQDEIGTDRFHEKKDFLYMVGTRSLYSGSWIASAGTPPAFGPALKEENPEIVNSARIQNGTNDMVVKYKEKIFVEPIKAGDFSLLEMFTFSLVRGNLETVKNDPFGIFITEKIAEKYFTNEDPIGKTLIVDNRLNYTVAGILKNMPANSLISFDLLVPCEALDNLYNQKGYTRTWYNLSFRTFAETGKNVSIEDINKRIENRIIQGNNNMEQVKPFLRKYSEIYLYGLKGDGWMIGQVIMFGMIAGIVLLIACINFMNLSTARAGTRAREVGMRKVMGAHRKNIIKQFFGESILLTVVSFVIALVLSYLLLPAFNGLSNKNLSFDISGHAFIILGMIGIVIFTGVISGSYPSFFLASFKPANVLKSSKGSGTKSSVFRKVLVVIQFGISIILIICTIVVFKQLNFLLDKNLGLEKDQIVYTRGRGEVRKDYNIVKQELLKNPDILNVTCSQSPITGIYWNGHNWNWEGRDEQTDPLVTYLYTDTDFLKTFSIQMSEGEFFSEKTITSGTETSPKIIINEFFSNLMGEGSKIGKTLSQGNTYYTIIGVVKDFHFKPLHTEMQPIILFHNLTRPNYIFMKIRPVNVSATLKGIETVFKKVNPDYPFSVRFLDEDFQRLYNYYKRRGKLFQAFAFLAIFISCLGLFGLASFIAERRTKEIGIRKALGANISNILILLNKEFLTWVLTANTLAWPVAYYFSKSLLQGFPYRINLGIELFLFSGLAALLIAVVTISVQSIKAARINPADSLRYE